MRVARHLVLGALVTIASYAALSGQAMDAAQVLAAARQALGGEKALSSVATFVATGRTRQLRGNNLVPIEFEINCELPDKFVRRDEIPAQDTDPSTTGFAGDTLIQIPPPAQGPPRGGGPAPAGRGPGGPPPAQRVIAIKQDFARLMLGVFAGSFPGYPLTLTYAAEGDAPEGKADILNVTGPANFSARLVVQRDTHLPVMLMWNVPAPPQAARGPAAAPAAPAAPPAAPGAPVAPVEYRMYYADFRDVNGIKWPFRIRRAIAGNTVEETTFDRVRINVKIDPRKFAVPK